jgi:anhydro-N-acetylmuramic acid kinase
MVYRAIGIMSGSSLDGLDLAFAEFQEQGGKWTYEIKETACYIYEEEWATKLKNAASLTALDYQLLHTAYGHYIGEKINAFIDDRNLHYQVALIASHGHTTFHLPAQKMTGQIGDGAAIAAVTKLPVVSDLRAMDVALGGQGAPIVPIGEKMLLPEYDYFLNIGGIANISANSNPFIAFDICPANRVLNMLANELNEPYDNGGKIAATGSINYPLLEKLNALTYYTQPYPKSLANDFGTAVVYPLIKDSGLSIEDGLRTYVEHIGMQITNAAKNLIQLKVPNTSSGSGGNLLVTGGGAFNTFLTQQLSEQLSALNIAVVVPDANLVGYKEALIMAFIGVLRWREEYNVLASVTGAERNSIGGALWMGQEA